VREKKKKKKNKRRSEDQNRVTSSEGGRHSKWEDEVTWTMPRGGVRDWEKSLLRGWGS